MIRFFQDQLFKDVLKIVVVYCSFSLFWIYFSDTLLLLFVKNVDSFSKIQTYKGIAFVIITSLFLFILIRSELTKRALMRQKLEQNEQRLEYVIQGANLGYWDWDYVTGEHLVNDTWLDILGLSRDDIKNHVSDWKELVHPDDSSIGITAIEQTIKDHKTYTIEFRMRHKKGHWVWIEGSGAVVERDTKTGAPLRIAGTHKDISFRKSTEEKMHFLAFNDALTKLPNRTYLKKRLESFLQTVSPQPFAFLFLDLDYFKNINDAFGHSFGDQVIQDVALRFKDTLKEEDFIARVGGDEFVILTHNIHKLERLCKNLSNAIEKPFHIQGESFSLGTSIGISLFPEDGATFELLFKHADTAMYAAKSSGKNRFKYYTARMGETALESTKMDIEMRRAITNDEFTLFYQPQVELSSGKLIGIEALIRWMDPEKGMIPPDAFIPRAEENRLMVPIGTLVLRKALTQMKVWIEKGVFTGKIAINISSVQIEEEDFITTLSAILNEVGIDAGHIELEVTESAIMANEKQFIQTLRELKKLGFSISIDDFGTGYSSLNYIKTLPIDTLKIDRTFVKDLPDDRDDIAITMVIITLAKQLGLSVIAEGIETEAQQEFLMQNGCHKAQGYLFAHPMDAASFEAFCHTQKA